MTNFFLFFLKLVNFLILEKKKWNANDVQIEEKEKKKNALLDSYTYSRFFYLYKDLKSVQTNE